MKRDKIYLLPRLDEEILNCAMTRWTEMNSGSLLVMASLSLSFRLCIESGPFSPSFLPSFLCSFVLPIELLDSEG